MHPNGAIHIAIRYADKIQDREVQTIQLHQDLIQKNGAVWFGKLGQPLSEKNISTINTQCQLGTPTYLYLIRGRAEGLYKGSVAHMTRELPPPEEEALIPQYYKDFGLRSYMKFWIRLSKLERLSKSEFHQLEVPSAHSKLDNLIRGNTAGLFIVKYSAATHLEPL